MIAFGAPVLQAFSGALLTLSALPASVAPPRVMDAGLDALRDIVPFDAAWWGECSGGVDGLAPRNWLSGQRHLPEDFADEWNRIGTVDRFARESMARLGSAVRSSGFADPSPEVEAFARRHDICHVLAITRGLPGSGLLQFLALYRHTHSPAFDAPQALLFEAFTAHLMQRFSQRVRELIGAAGLPVGEDQALLDADGALVYVGARLGLALRERHPHWRGDRLPEPLADRLRQLPTQCRLGRHHLAAQPVGDLVLLSLAPRHRAPALPPRELGVALLYAEGRSHKDIARATGLSPATVRTYLRDAYLRLGVSDKVALGRVLTGARPKRRRA